MIFPKGKREDLLWLRSPTITEIYLRLLGGLAPSVCLSLLVPDFNDRLDGRIKVCDAEPSCTKTLSQMCRQAPDSLGPRGSKWNRCRNTEPARDRKDRTQTCPLLVMSVIAVRGLYLPLAARKSSFPYRLPQGGQNLIFPYRLPAITV